MNIIKVKTYVFLHAILILYSLVAILSKMAATKMFLSIDFIFYYGIILIILCIYAILWQQVLKKVPLTVAFANKSVVVIWGMIWGNLFFKEKITFGMIVGAAIIFIGVYLVVVDNG